MVCAHTAQDRHVYIENCKLLSRSNDSVLYGYDDVDYAAQSDEVVSKARTTQRRVMKLSVKRNNKDKRLCIGYASKEWQFHKDHSPCSLTNAETKILIFGNTRNTENETRGADVDDPKTEPGNCTVCAIVMPEMIDVFTAIEEDRYVQEDYFCLHALQLLLDLRRLHAQGIVHRDIKPENVLICSKNGSLHLSDFGFSLKMSRSDLKTLVENCGTSVYAAPEVFADGNTPILDFEDLVRRDIWAVVMTILVMYVKCMPFGTKSTQVCAQSHYQRFREVQRASENGAGENGAAREEMAAMLCLSKSNSTLLSVSLLDFFLAGFNPDPSARCLDSVICEFRKVCAQRESLATAGNER
jgi:serine/threonine protein kinase